MRWTECGGDKDGRDGYSVERELGKDFIVGVLAGSKKTCRKCDVFIGFEIVNFEIWREKN